MYAELQVLSPLVPVREVNILRFCKQHAEGVWAVVDVSIDNIRDGSGGGAAFPASRRLPSGCVVQDMPNGYSKVMTSISLSFFQHMHYFVGLSLITHSSIHTGWFLHSHLLSLSRVGAIHLYVLNKFVEATAPLELSWIHLIANIFSQDLIIFMNIFF